MNNSDFLKQQPNLALAGKLKIVIWILTAAVLGLVAVMREVKFELPDGVSLSFLPAVHAILNSCVAILLVAALIFVKAGKYTLHKNAITAAMTLSILFLLCYVSYHFTNEETKYGGEGALRIIYYVLLISHIVLAAVSFPFILFTWMYGFTNQFAKHRKLSKIVFPMWLYVAVTGPVCYLLLRPYY